MFVQFDIEAHFIEETVYLHTERASATQPKSQTSLKINQLSHFQE